MADADLPRYDRDFLLSPAKRSIIIQLWEVERFSRSSPELRRPRRGFALRDERPASGMRAGSASFAAQRLRRCANPLGNRIGEDVARIAARVPTGFGVRRSRSFCGLMQRAILDSASYRGAGRARLRVRARLSSTWAPAISASLGASIKLVQGDLRQTA